MFTDVFVSCKDIMTFDFILYLRQIDAEKIRTGEKHSLMPKLLFMFGQVRGEYLVAFFDSGDGDKTSAVLGKSGLVSLLADAKSWDAIFSQIPEDRQRVYCIPSQ